MTKKDTENSELTAFRQQIDALDEKLIALLMERIGIVKKVGDIKRKTHPGQCPIRPGREAAMVRELMKKCENAEFPPAAVAAMWRILIGASTSVESALKLAVFTPDNDPSLYWLAREYFGSFLPVNRHPHVKRVIGDIMDGKASVGIVPTLHGADTSYWWTNLVQPGGDLPKIFAHIPFVYNGTPSRDIPTGLAIAQIEPEASGDDISLIVLEAEHNTSQHRLQGAFAQAKLEPNWVSVATIGPATRHHLIELKGFITAGHPAITALQESLGASIVNLSFLGAYAVPVTLKSSEPARAGTSNAIASKA